MSVYRSSVAIRDKFLGLVDAAPKPCIADMGYDWEYHISGSSKDLWKVNRMVAPREGTKVRAAFEVVMGADSAVCRRKRSGLG
jgi:hypothetical protein